MRYIDYFKKVGFKIRITDTMLKKAWKLIRRFCMKKFILIACMLVLMAGYAYAEVELSSIAPLKLIPSIENGWFYDIKKGEVINATGAKILGGPKDTVWEGLEISGMWGTGVDGGNDRTGNLVLGTLGYRIGALDKFGLELPLKGIFDIKFCIMAGYNMDDKEPAYGLGIDVIRVKF